MPHSLDQIANEIRQTVAAKPLDGSVKFNFGDGQVITVVGADVSLGNGETDCTVEVDIPTYARIASGDLDPTDAYLNGEVQVSGNPSVALALFDVPDVTASAVPRFDADADPHGVAESLKSKGFAVVERCADEELADWVAGELRPHFDKLGTEDQDDFNGYTTLRAYQILARSRSSAELIGHDMVLGVADEILLPHCINYRIGSCSDIEIWPGEVTQVLHRDDAIYPMHIAGVEWQISALWALTDFTEENGATHVLPGSHGSSLRVEMSKKGDTVQAAMPKGSLLLYLGSTYHGGGANRAAEPRMGLVNTYSVGWLRQEENQYLSLPREVVESYPKTIRDLIGYRPHGPILGTWGEYED